jgi:hypothetical protein
LNWQFTILKPNGEEVVIEEPIGWDKLKIKIERDLEKHGVFFDYSENELEFVDGFKLIKAEYEQYGADGQMTLIISWGCDGNFEEVYRGRLVFSQYKQIDAPYCSCKIPVETTRYYGAKKPLGSNCRFTNHQSIRPGNAASHLQWIARYFRTTEQKNIPAAAAVRKRPSGI